MPIVSSILTETSLVLTLWYSRVTLSEWKEHLTNLLDDPMFDSTSLHLVDIRSADLSAIGQAEIADIVRFLQPSRERISGRKLAILAGKEMPKANLAADLIGTLGISLATFVFSGTALKWLQLEAHAVEPHLSNMRRELPRTN